MYIQNKEKIIWVTVSKAFPFHNSDEYPKNWMNSRVVQKTANPRAIFLPRPGSVKSWGDVTQSKPIRNTVKAIKRV
jgi:hypothetical protein